MKKNIRTNVLKEIDTPLKLYALVILVIETAFIPLIYKTSGVDKTYLIVGFIIVLVFFLYIFWRKLPSHIIENDKILKKSDLVPITPADSKYSSNELSEIDRLRIQADRHLEFDSRILDSVIAKKEGLINIMDIGCADGYLTYSRFNKYNNIKRIICVDKSKVLIPKAQLEYNSDSRFEFYSLDICDCEFINDISKLSIKYDIIFMAYTIHHIGDRINLFRKLRSLLKDNGTLVIRDLDDNSKLMYPRSDILDYIIKETKEAPGQSDRESARKLYYELTKAKFSIININYDFSDTIGLDYEQRLAFFNECFTFRADNMKRLVQNGNVEYEAKYKALVEAIDYVGSLFKEDEEFYYMESVVIVVASK
jgi:SAM-dependent methyltransferase